MLFNYIIKLFINKAYLDIIDYFYIKTEFYFGPIFNIFNEIN